MPSKSTPSDPPKDLLKDLNGLLVVDKTGFDPAQPQARLWTSHDVVARVRRLSGQRRIGHTGTLDPMASGVLILCLGQATRLVEYYQGHDKRYHAVVALGSATDTYDATGQVIIQKPVPTLSAAQVEAALARFRGDIEQMPPIYSALKQEGEALYAKARRGEAVTVAARPVTIHQLTLVAQTATTLTLDITCSAGTYIRSLAHDLGEALGTVAHLAELRRSAAGSFTLDDAHTLPTIEAAAEAGTFAELLLPLGAALGLPLLPVDEATALRLSQGQRVPLDSPTIPDPKNNLAMAESATGSPLGIVRCVESHGSTQIWKAEKWLAIG
ncbi:MAG: tRNA pseudouridine(55) synthase TruB [Caldilineaceae bacterium]|nr:tRNA pseudouridine(55) synthase TruB [Caldilineaceae bacterium]